MSSLSSIVLSTALIEPLLALVSWTFVMWLWMYVTRIPAMKAAAIDLDEVARTGDPVRLPATVTRVADNYNHLHEQPVIFYALALAGTVLGQSEGLIVYCAWAYVGIRIIHSLLQATVNKIIVRFMLFNLGTFALIGMLGVLVNAIL